MSSPWKCITQHPLYALFQYATYHTPHNVTQTSTSSYDPASNYHYMHKAGGVGAMHTHIYATLLTSLYCDAPIYIYTVKIETNTEN